MPSRRKKIEALPEGYLAFSVLTLVQRHVNTNYDMIKYHGKMKSINPKAYQQQATERNKIIYSIIEKNCERKPEEIFKLALYMVAEYNMHTTLLEPHRKIFFKPSDFTYNNFLRAYEEHLTRSFNRKESFQSDLKFIVDAIAVPTENVRKTLVKLLAGDAVSATISLYKTMIQNPDALPVACETLIVLDQISGASEKIIADPDNKDSVYGDIARRINKISKLYRPDLRKYEKFILDFCREMETTPITGE